MRKNTSLAAAFLVALTTLATSCRQRNTPENAKANYREKLSTLFENRCYEEIDTKISGGLPFCYNGLLMGMHAESTVVHKEERDTFRIKSKASFGNTVEFENVSPMPQK